MKTDGFFIIFRELFNDPLWLNGSPTMKLLIIYLMGKVNHEPNMWVWEGEKFEVQRGQTITSLEKLQKEIGKGVSIQNIRTALNNLEKYGFLTNKSTKTGRLITIVNYDELQSIDNEDNKDINKDLTKTQQRPNKDLTSNNNDNHNNNDNNNKQYINDIIYTQIKEIITYLNEKANTSYRPTTKKTISLIKARFNEGFNIDDFKTVIDKKISSWTGTEWEKFIRPETLFGTKFESYLNEKVTGKGGTNANNRGSPKRFENEREYTDEEQRRIEEKFYA